jgi:hypothetical protein
MRSPPDSRGMILLRRIYDVLDQVLWAFGIAMGLVTIWAILHISQARDIFQRIRAQEIFEENRTYCEKWGMRAGTHEHTLCTFDLNEIRAKHERRINDDMIF